MDQSEKFVQLRTSTCPICQERFYSGEDTCPHDNVRLVVVDDPLIGQLIADRYEVVGVLGKGGWSRVYKARQTNLNRFVAIKIMHSYLAFEDASIQRFKQEAEAASLLSHPNIAQIFDYGFLPDGGPPYIVMEYVEGSDLAELVANQGALQPQLAVEIISQAVEALGYAHSKGIVHRDIKPRNIFFNPQTNNVKVLDFGLAKIARDEDDKSLTGTGHTLGTPEYMSPEQCLASPLTGQSDIYSLGCVAYELLTGCKAVLGNTQYEIMHQHLNAAPVPPASLNAQLNEYPVLTRAVMKALEKDQSKRFATMAEMKQHLQDGLRIRGDASESVHNVQLGKAKDSFEIPLAAFLCVLLLAATACGFLFFLKSSSTKTATVDKPSASAPEAPPQPAPDPEKQPAEAEKYYAVKMQELKAQGKSETPEFAVCRWFMAWSKLTQRKAAEAEPLYRESIDWCNKHMVPGDTTRLKILIQQSAVYEQLGDLGKSNECLAEIAKAASKPMPDNFSYTAVVVVQRLYCDRGKLVEALALSPEVVRQAKLVMGESSPECKQALAWREELQKRVAQLSKQGGK